MALMDYKPCCSQYGGGISSCDHSECIWVRNTQDSEILRQIALKSEVKNSRLRQDLPVSINDRVILPFREGFIFTKLPICEVL